ncbi:MAG: hypothetical protein O7J95_00120 [Planctomycetota bacterium]|nr:hypothetical protein [Planctomycetota bacterium]
MADQESLSKNMDKISYAAAAVLGVAVLAVPLFSGGGLEGSVRDLKKKRDEVERRIENGPDEGDPEGGEIDVLTKIEGQWSIRPGRASVSWVTELMPIRKTITARIERGSAKHLAGRVEAISFERDPEKTKPFILVKGSMSPENSNIMLRRVTLYRSVGDDDPVPVSGFKADVEPNGSFTYADYDIEPGNTYTYSFASFAASTDPENLILAPEQREARSGPLGPSPAVPYDYKFTVRVFQANNDPPAVRATASWWDYEKGELGMIKKTKTFREKETFGPGGRWRIRRVNQKYVQIKDSLTLDTEKISTKDGRRSVEAWEPILAAAPVDEAAQEEEAATRREKSPRARSATAIALEEARRRRETAAAKKAEEEAETKKKPKGRKRRGFGR